MGEGGPSVDLETRVEWVARVGEDGILRCSITSRDEYKRKLFKGMCPLFSHIPLFRVALSEVE